VNKDAVLKVLPLEIPDRAFPATKPRGTLPVRLVERPGEDFEVAWASIVGIEFFEQKLLAEAQRLTAAGEFDGAYDYYARLIREDPSLPGLDDAINAYLQKNALAAYQKSNYAKSLALLTALYDRSPEFPGVGRALEAVTGRMIASYIKDHDYAAARRMLDVWRTRYKTVSTTAIGTWEQQFHAAAKQQLAEAGRLFRSKQFGEARKAVARALNIWPDLAGAQDLLAQIDREYPHAIVGVFEASPRRPTPRIDNWAAMRTSRLVEPTIVELYDFGSEGGMYRSPLGELELDNTGRRLQILGNALASTPDEGFVLSPAHALARYLLQLADTDNDRQRGEYEALIKSVSVEPQGGVVIEWSRRHVRPEALLQLPLPSGDWEAVELAAVMAQGPFRLAETNGELSTFQANDDPNAVESPKLIAILEETFTDDELAVKALSRGEIDVLDRAPPWHLQRLRSMPGIRVESYRLPTVHVLIPNYERRLAGNREFRRALCYAIDRERFVQQVLLGGAKISGFEVLSGPFPVGSSLSDPIRYAVNNQVQPRPYDPRLASMLVSVAWTTIHTIGDKVPDDLPPIPELVLVHPADPIARAACESIKRHLQAIGLSVTLQELSTQELLDGTVEYDLRYAELAIWEPVVDAWTLLAPGGLAGLCTHPMNLALRQLEGASNWADVRSRLASIHQLAHNDLPVIPLWQTVNYFAYRTTLTNVGGSPVVLYQDAAKWQIRPPQLSLREN
jgi:tetratricopeptide (TPR) repeat protein